MFYSQMKALKMNDEELHFRHIILHKFRKGSVGNETETFTKFVYIALQHFGQLKSGLANFDRVILNLNDQIRSGRPPDIDDDATVCHHGE